MPGEHIDIATPDGVADAYLSRPDDERHPGVLLLMDAFGLRPQIEHMADRIAAHGYVVLAPNLFYRAGRSPVVDLEGLADPDQRGKVIEKVMPLVGELTPERIDARRRRLPAGARGVQRRPGRDHRLLHGRARRLADRHRAPGPRRRARRLPHRRARHRARPTART